MNLPQTTRIDFSSEDCSPVPSPSTPKFAMIDKTRKLPSHSCRIQNPRPGTRLVLLR